MFRNENLVLTYAAGEDFLQLDSFWVFINTASTLPDTDVVIITHEMSDLVRNRLVNFNVELVDVDLLTSNILQDRHLHFWKYLNDHGHKYRYISICDSKDILFQSSPFDWIENSWKPRFNNINGNKTFLNNFVILTSEGFHQSQSGFATIEHFEFQRDIPPQCFIEASERDILNGGFSLGTPQAIQNHEFLMWSVTMKTLGRCTDQATLNYLMVYLEEDATYSVSKPFNDTLCLHGEGVKEGFVEEPIILNEKLHNPYLKKPYCVVHQWDRLKNQFKECALLHLDE